MIAVWAASGPVFHFSSKCAQLIGTGTALLSFPMVVLMQNTQNRDSRAINLKFNLKLDELIRAMEKARNHMIDIARLTGVEPDEMRAGSLGRLYRPE